MKAFFFACFFFGCTLVLKSQRYSDYVFTDQRAVHIPAAETYSTASIAGYVQSNFKTEPEKLRAIYTWVITNIRYDTDSMLPINWSLESAEKIAATLRRRKGVCENYASLFTDIALKSGFPSFVVSGYTRQSGAINKTGHSWSAVYLQQHWYLCDPTWDIGSNGNTKYFLVSPDEFIETHMPFDPLWQLLNYPVTQDEFSHGIFTSKKNKSFFNYADSAIAFLQLDSLKQLEAGNQRIRQAGIENERQQNWLNYNQMKVAIIYGEKDMNLYNDAVADLNKAYHVFNNFVQFRNDRFLPAKADAETQALLQPVNGLLTSALKKLDQMGGAVENFQYDAGTIKVKINNLIQRVNEQQVFLNRYISTALADREKLFYK